MIIGNSRALGKLTEAFREKYPEEDNIYVTGTPNIEILLAEPMHFGWYTPPILTESQLTLLQGGLSLGSFGYVLYNDWWGEDTLFDVTLVFEAMIGAL